MNKLDFFREYNEQIFKVYDELNLKNLSQVEFEGKNSVSYFSEVLRSKSSIKPLPYSDFKIHDELDFITKDIKYIIGVLYFLRPHIVDTEFNDGKYLQNLEDHRYLTYASFGVQAVHNYWDRLGDLLYLFFETGLREDSVYLSRVLNNVKPWVKLNSEYKLFKVHFDEFILPFLKERHNVVHHFQLEVKYYWGAIESHQNKVKREELNVEKFGWVEELTRILSDSIKGFDLTLKLIDILPNS